MTRTEERKADEEAMKAVTREATAGCANSGATEMTMSMDAFDGCTSTSIMIILIIIPNVVDGTMTTEEMETRPAADATYRRMAAR